MQRNSKIRTCLCLLPAVVVLICVALSLRGYEPAVYAVEAEDLAAIMDEINVTDAADAAASSDAAAMQVTQALAANEQPAAAEATADEQSAATEAAADEQPVVDAVAESVAENSDEAANMTASTELPTLADGPYADGVYTAAVDCYDKEAEAIDEELNFDYSLTMNITIENNRITAISDVVAGPSAYNPVYDTQNDVYLMMAQMGAGDVPGVVEQIIAAQTYEVDAVSGATYSSECFMDAARIALEKARIKD